MTGRKKIDGIFTGIRRFVERKNCNDKLDLKESEEKIDLKEKEEAKVKLLDEIELVKNELKIAIARFNYQIEAELIESSIYFVRALETKLNFLIKEAKRKNIKCDEKNFIYS